MSDRAEGHRCPPGAGVALAQVDSADGPVKLIDPELLQRAIDNLVEA